MNNQTMPPGRDDIPLNHPRRIAKIAHLPERELQHESVEVRQLCRDYREGIEAKLRASEKQAKVERGDMYCTLAEAVRSLMARCELTQRQSFYEQVQPEWEAVKAALER